ncbi:MAG: anthranilate synthase component I family protein [Candidatus Omnitrophica bacterium]|nr:anthranilate synthase component I family protein [Candidatus Omnitrophota bacterium]
MKKTFSKTYDFSGKSEDIFLAFSDEPMLFFLDSSLSQPSRGRFSFIGFKPFDIVSASGKNSLEMLQDKFDQHQICLDNQLTPFSSGAVGFLGYELGGQWEDILLREKPGISLPDCFFGFYNGVIAIDHVLNKLHIITTGIPEKNDLLREKKALEDLRYIENRLNKEYKEEKKQVVDFDFSEEYSQSSEFSSNFTKEKYLEAVDRALEYIRQGDIYQVNLSQRFLLKKDFSNTKDLARLYVFLRAISPSSFGSYFDAGDFQIISSSPEEFLCKRGQHIETTPMKGTRPRSQNIIDDEIFKRDLLESPKEKAELLMVTDLERNDLGKVCLPGSVRVRSMRTLEEYRTVFQTTSTVEGVLAENKNVFDILRACFPSGSVTGCPKIRAMQIINELEPNKREAYTGSFGYIGFDESMDFNILIRTLVAKKDKLSFHVGGGIVADSIAENEYDETLLKALALRKSISSIFLEKLGV